MLPAASKPVVLSPRLILWLVFDLFGMALFAVGALYLANGEALLGRLPSSIVEAAVFLVAGGVLMLMAAANVISLFRPGRKSDEADRVLGLDD